MKNNIIFIIFFLLGGGGGWKVKKGYYVNKVLGMEGGDGYVFVVYLIFLVVG